MSGVYDVPQSYRANYIKRVAAQNQELFSSDYVWTFEPEDLPLKPRELFPEARRFFLEIGFGHGEVLEQLVKADPDTAFIGIERRPFRVRKALKRLHRVGTQNAKLVRINLELAQQELFAPGSFDEILVNHPDPWPKKRHLHHRFFNPVNLAWLKGLLAPGGCIEAASDHPEYFFSILHLFECDPELESLLPPPFYTAEPLPGRPMSRFEVKKRQEGETVRIIRFQKI